MGAGYQSNGTFGRVQTMQCTKDDPTGEKQHAKALLADLQDQWQAHTSGEVPLSPSSSLALRGELDRLSKIVYGDVPMMSAGYSGAETARRQANTIGMFAGGPVFAALPAAGRLLGAPEAAVESLGEINANLAGAGAMGRGRVAKKPSAGMAAPAGPPSGAAVKPKAPPGADSAQNIATKKKLADQLRKEEASSAFNSDGTLSQEAINGSKPLEGYGPGELKNPAIPADVGKFETRTFQSPWGDFKVHFYMNPTTGQVYYGLDFKAILNSQSGVPKKL